MLDIDKRHRLTMARRLTRIFVALNVLGFCLASPPWVATAILAINACVWLVWTLELSHEIDLLTLRDAPIRERRDA